MTELGAVRGYADFANRVRDRAVSAVGNAASGRVTPIDHAHLGRYTLGNRDLELEVLDLFLGEIPQTMSKLKAAATAENFDPKAWFHACHTLKGSALAVGAVDVAKAAEQAEKLQVFTRDDLASHIAEIGRTVGGAAAYIEVWRKS